MRNKRLKFVNILLVSVLIFTACQENDIVCCNEFGTFEKSYDTSVYVNGVATTIDGIVKNAISPLNKHYFDSLVYDST